MLIKKVRHAGKFCDVNGGDVNGDYRPSRSASTSSATARTRTPSSASFSSSPVSTVSPVTTGLSVFCPPTGSTSPPPPPPWSRKVVLVMEDE